MFDFNEHQRKQPFTETKNGCKYRVMPQLQCVDGFKMSVQASETHHCSPRFDEEHTYFELEVGYPSERVEELMPFAEDTTNPTHMVYGWVPVEIVNNIINARGGLKTV